MANQYLTRQEITYAKLEVLENNTVVVPNLYRDLDQEFGKKGGKIDEVEAAARIAFGARLGTYRFDRYRTKEKAEDKPAEKSEGGLLGRLRK